MPNQSDEKVSKQPLQNTELLDKIYLKIDQRINELKKEIHDLMIKESPNSNNQNDTVLNKQKDKQFRTPKKSESNKKSTTEEVQQPIFISKGELLLVSVGQIFQEEVIGKIIVRHYYKGETKNKETNEIFSWVILCDDNALVQFRAYNEEGKNIDKKIKEEQILSLKNLRPIAATNYNRGNMPYEFLVLPHTVISGWNAKGEWEIIKI